MGKHYQLFSVITIYKHLGKEISKSLPIFHALSDTTSSFNGKGKRSAWQAWLSFPEETETLENLVNAPLKHLDIGSNDFKTTELLIVILYGKKSPLNSVNEARRELFCKRNRAMEKLPTTQGTLLQHVRRTVYQAGIWTNSTNTNQELPSLQNFGWTYASGSQEPV
jgi:hypothetical protein